MSGSIRSLAAAALLFASAVAAAQCRRAAPPPAATPAAEDLRPVVTVKELMENVVDPIADNIFDAVAVDVTEKGTVEHKPTTDEEWARVNQGAVTLAEASNLLKIPRRIAPPGDTNNSKGPNAPELSPEEIQKKVDADRALWVMYANGLRDQAVKVMDIVKARDAGQLFAAGSDIDKACENCHLEYWYPGDKKAVLEDEKKGVYYTKPVQKH